MPIYDYACGGCGEFSALRPLAQWRDPADCPQCGASSERIGRARRPSRRCRRR